MLLCGSLQGLLSGSLWRGRKKENEKDIIRQQRQLFH